MQPGPSKAVRPPTSRVEDAKDLNHAVADPVRNQIRRPSHDELPGTWDSSGTADAGVFRKPVHGADDGRGHPTRRSWIVSRDVRPRLFEIGDGAAKPDDLQRGGFPSFSLPQDSSHDVTRLCSTNCDAAALSEASRVLLICSTCHSFISR